MLHSRLLAVGCLALLASSAPAPCRADEDEIETVVTAMAKVGASGSASFSPDGKRIGFVSGLSGTNQLWIIASQGGWPEQITSLNGSVANSQWSPDGQWIAFHFVPGGGGGQQVYMIHPDGTGLRRLTDGGKESNFLDGWSPDSRYLMIASNRHESKSIDAYVYDLQRSELRLVTATPALEELVRISPDGRHGLLYREGGRGDNDFFLVDLETGEERLLTPHTPPGSFEFGYFSPDGRTLYMSSDKDRELPVLVRVRLDDQGRPGPMEVIASRSDVPLEQFALAPDGRTGAVSWNVAGRSELHSLDMETLKQGPAIELPNDIVAQLRFSQDGREVSMIVLGTAAPPNVWVLNRESGKFRQLTFSSHPGVDLSTLVRPELVTFKSFDGLQISGWLYRPRDAQGPVPLVVILHGGPEAQERPTFLGTYQELVRHGMMVFAPNVRGSVGFGKRFTHLDNGALRFNAVRDVKAGVDELVRRGLADPGHVGVFGFSSGGFLALSAIVDYPQTFRAGALLSGLVDLGGFFQKTEKWLASISKTEYGDPEKDAAMLREISPIQKIDTVTAPLLVIHGALDTNVPVEQADQVVESLKRRQVPVQYLRFPDERHGVSELPNRIRYSVAVVKWFDTYLKGDSAPRQSAQAKKPAS
jgi:dipeptidyl aminopeptidase/acylaminoacyl peptidase